MHVTVFVRRTIQMKHSTELKIAKFKKRKLCLACGKPLGTGKVVRGCHEKCAHATYRAIERGETTDDEAVQEGFWLPHAKRGPKPKNAVTTRYRSRSAS